MTLTRADIAEHIVDTLDFPRVSAPQFVDDFFELIMQSLEKGHEVKLTGFGNFVVRLKKARPGRNPRTGEDVTISPRKVVSFHAGPKLRSQLAEYNLALEEKDAEQAQLNIELDIEVDYKQEGTQDKIVAHSVLSNTANQELASALISKSNPDKANAKGNYNEEQANFTQALVTGINVITQALEAAQNNKVAKKQQDANKFQNVPLEQMEKQQANSLYQEKEDESKSTNFKQQNS